MTSANASHISNSGSIKLLLLAVHDTKSSMHKCRQADMQKQESRARGTWISGAKEISNYEQQEEKDYFHHYMRWMWSNKTGDTRVR